MKYFYFLKSGVPIPCWIFIFCKQTTISLVKYIISVTCNGYDAMPEMAKVGYGLRLRKTYLYHTCSFIFF